MFCSVIVLGMTKTILESVDSFAIPSSIHESLDSKKAHLAAEKVNKVLLGMMVDLE
jgi:hypothetical protein